MERTTNPSEIISLVEDLKQYDNDQGYKLSYEKVKDKLENTIKQLIGYGEDCVEYLHPILDHDETWSCLFALETLKEIKSEKSLFPLINFIKNNEDGDYWESCEDAMFALAAIGEPAVKPLLDEVKSNFKDKKYFIYLVGALTEIKHDDVYSFMEDTLKDYLEKSSEYDSWFKIEDFVYNLDKQGKKEILPLLKKILEMDHLSRHEQIEIKDTIEIIEHPKKFKKEMDDMAKSFKRYEELKKEDINEKELLEKAIDFESKKDYDSALGCVTKILAVYPKSYHALFLKVRIKRKIGKPDIVALKNTLKEAKKQKASKEVLDLIEAENERVTNLFREAETTSDEELELNFRCNDCGKRDNLKIGLVWHVEDGNRFLFENEIMCKHCSSHNLELTKEAHLDLCGHYIRMMTGESCGILHISKKVYTENKLMKFSKSYPYLLKRIEEEPLNAELCLRAGNSARKLNNYEDAIKHYEKAVELNPRLIAAYLNLVEIYQYRYDYYKIKEARDKAVSYLSKMKETYDSQDYDGATLKNPKEAVHFIREKEIELGIASDYKKIKDEDVEQTLKKASTFDVGLITKNIIQSSEDSEEEIKDILIKNNGMLVFQSYHVFDKYTKESKRLDATFVEPIDPSKKCVCGSGKFLSECCFKHIIAKKPFVINIDYATYSLSYPLKDRINAIEDFTELVNGFKSDRRFYCDEETKNKAFFLYYGPTFYTVNNLGTVVFGTFTIKKELFNNKAIVELEALSKERFDSLSDAVQEHLE
jgi:tetratricopeptide (TPR) repeat protein